MPDLKELRLKLDRKRKEEADAKQRLTGFRTRLAQLKARLDSLRRAVAARSGP